MRLRALRLGFRVVAVAALVVATAACDVVRVGGASMRPTLVPGDIVLVSTWAEPRVGDIVLFERGGGTVVHRVSEIRSGDQLVTCGDANPVPDPSPVPRETVTGVVRAVLRIGRR